MPRARTYRDSLHNQRADVRHNQEPVLDLQSLHNNDLRIQALEHEKKGQDVSDSDDEVERQVHISLGVVEINHIALGLGEICRDAISVVES